VILVMNMNEISTTTLNTILATIKIKSQTRFGLNGPSSVLLCVTLAQQVTSVSG
jgi:hypothetical protein